MAAASKRFLGLGFTFAATDKGLENKLKSVSEYLSKISNQLDDIGKASVVASKGMKSFAGQEVSAPTTTGKVLKGSKISSLKGVPSYSGRAAKPPENLGEMFQKNLAKRIGAKEEPIKNLTKEINKNLTKMTGVKEEPIQNLAKEINKNLVKKSIPKSSSDCCIDIIIRLDLIHKSIMDFHGDMKKLDFSKASFSSGPRQEKPRQPNFGGESKTFNKTFTDSLKNVLDKQSLPREFHDFTKGLLEKARKVLNDRQFNEFEETLGDMRVSLDENGMLMADSMIKMVKYFDTFTSRAKESSKEMSKVNIFFKGIKQYFSEVFGAAENFLDSVGIRIREMIPPQVGAALNLVKTAITPILTLPGFFKKMSDEKYKKRSLNSLDGLSEIGKSMLSVIKASTDELTGKVTNPSGVVSKLDQLLNEDDKKPDGIFDKLKNFLLGLPLIGPLLGSLGKVIKFLISPFRALGGLLTKIAPGFLNLAKAVFNFLNPFKLIPRLLTMFTSNIGTVIRFLGRFAAPLVVVGAALWGFIEGVIEAKGKWKDVANSLVRMWDSFTRLSSTVFNKLIGALESGWNYLVDKLAGIADVILTPIKNAFSNVGSMIIKMITNIFGQDIGNYASMVGEAISQFFKSLFEIAFKFIKNPLGMIKDGWKELGKTLPDVLSFGVDAVTDGMDSLNESLGGAAEDVPIPEEKIQEPVRAKKEQNIEPNLKDFKNVPLASEDNTDIVNSQKSMASKIDTTNLLLQRLITVMQSNSKPVNVSVSGGGASVDKTMNAMRARDNFNAVSQGL